MSWYCALYIPHKRDKWEFNQPFYSKLNFVRHIPSPFQFSFQGFIYHNELIWPQNPIPFAIKSSYICFWHTKRHFVVFIHLNKLCYRYMVKPENSEIGLLQVGTSWHRNLSILLANGPLSRYVKLRIAHAPGMPGTFSPPPLVSDPDIQHGTCVMHMPWCMPVSLTSSFPWSRWRGKRSRHSRRMRNPQHDVYVVYEAHYEGNPSVTGGPLHKRLVTLNLRCFPLLLAWTSSAMGTFLLRLTLYFGEITGGFPSQRVSNSLPCRVQQLLTM